MNLIGRSLLLQVANYCSERLHLALAEELGVIKDDLSDGTVGESQQVQWEKAFTNCFQRVDDEIEGKVSGNIIKSDGNASEASFEPIAPETVGSTAVVALVCSSHIIVANCGDSRAVLCRGKQAIALSVDHKVSMCFWFTFYMLREKAFSLCRCRNQSLFYLLNFCSFVIVPSQTEKMNMQGLRQLGARSYNGMGIVFLVFLLCRGL